MSKAYSISNNIQEWDTIPVAPAQLLALAEARKLAAAPSVVAGQDVDVVLLRQALGYLDPHTGYEEWRDRVAAIGAAMCPNARDIAHQWSRGELDREGRYADGCLSYDAEAVDRVLDTMPPKEGGLGVGTIEHQAREAGWQGTLAPRQDPTVTFAPYLATLAEEQIAQRNGGPPTSGPRLLRSFMGEEILTIIPPRWLARDTFPIPAVGIAFGKRGVFKTGVALSALAAVLTGAKMFGKIECEQGAAVIVEGEGLPGLRQRTEALAAHHGRTLADFPLLVIGHVPRIGNDDEWDALIATIEARGLKDLKLIVIDHLSIMLGGADQNDATVGTVAMQRLQTLSAHFDCTVICLAHAGKDDDREVRGSSAFLDNVDFAYELKRVEDSDIVKLRCAKMRDGEAPEPFHLRADITHGAPVMVFTDKDDARRAEGKQVGLRRGEVSTVLAEMGACPGGANAWTGKTGGITTRTLAVEIAKARHTADGDGLEPSQKEIQTLVMALNREGRPGGHFDVLVVSEGSRGRQWAIAPGDVSEEAANV